MQCVRASWVLSAITLIALASGCAEKIAREELVMQLQSANPPTIVDVRSLGEFEAGHVPGALHLPFYSILSSSDRLPETEGELPLVVYCEHGPRAGFARAQLWFVSDHPVRFLEGHMTAWREDGLPMEPAADVRLESR